MLKDRIEDSLTFDNVILFPGNSKLLPLEVSVKSRITQTLRCNIPLLSVAMDTVTEHQTVICMAQEGGMGYTGSATINELRTKHALLKLLTRD